MTEETQLPESYQTQVANLSQVNVETVNSELARMSQSSAAHIEAEDVELSQSAALNIRAGNLTARQSGLAFVQADSVAMQESGAGVVRAATATINGGVGAALANQVEIGTAYAGIIAGREIRGEKIESMILLSRNVEGNVFTVVDTRGAIIAGLVGGLFAGILFLLGRMLFGRK
ncbi:MAG: hypothetical protein PHQ36_03860 [Anaerolineales bacterium]|nr:hypothetical protein [Anaerolineales bacterium]